MQRIIFFISVIILSFSCKAQTINLKQPLPQDETIRKGVLKNGMTYYLHRTDVTKNVASYYIIQNVGSILENDNQQGLAHFLEHMAFNGTESFEGKGILNTLEKEGIVFGKDINAYTSFDETVYNINNIPTTPELIEIGLQILYDWSNYLLLTEEEIDAERGVIKEEWRTRQNGRMRILQKTIGTKFNNSKYAKRLPIGLMDIIENFEYKALRDFYHDWYRTDLQAIAIIGDFNIDEMEAKIQAKFSSIPAIENPKERFLETIDDNDDMIFSTAMDKEISTPSIAFTIRHNKFFEDETIGDLKEGLLNGFITSILSSRIREISQQPDAPFVKMGIGYGSMLKAHEVLSISIYPKLNKQQEAFALAMLEINRAVKFGFTNTEIDRTKVLYINFYENQIAKLDDRSHKQIVIKMQNNYLENDPITDLVKKYEIVKSLFNQLSQEELLLQLQKIYTKKNRSLIVTGVEGRNNLTEVEAIKIIIKAENNTDLKPYEEEKELKPLMYGVDLKKGKIVSEKLIKEIGSTVFTLSNGITVHYKFVDKNKNKVSLKAISDGGLSLINDSDLPSASMATSLKNMSGLGEFSAIELPKVLAGKTARASTSINQINESVSGSSSTKDVETMLQLVNLHFTHPRFDKTAYNVLIQNIENNLISKKENLKSKMRDSTTVLLYGFNHPKKRLFNEAYIADLSFNKMQEIYKSRFDNAADFTFFIIGDVAKENLKPLLEKYIASIPTNDTRENWIDNSTNWIHKNIDKDIYFPMEDPKNSVRIAFKNDMEYNLKDELLMRALGNILQLRYTQSLREEEGGTYGARSNGSLTNKPRQQAYLSVSFDCNPDLVEKLVSIVYKEMETIKNGEVQQNDLDKVLANFLKKREENKNYNGYDMSVLLKYILENYNMNVPENYEDIVNSITKEDIQDITNRLLKDAESFEIIFKPEAN